LCALDSRVAREIREFHDVLVTNDTLPLDLLEEQVERWIKSKQTALQ
jgi:uncharacterized protein (DUF885 family)